MSDRKPSAKTAEALAQAREIAARNRVRTEFELHSTDSVQLYGAFVAGDSPGCQDYTKSIKLQGVRIVDEPWLMKLVAERDALLAALESIAADDYEAPHHANDADISREKGRLICRIKEAARSAIAAAKAGAA